MRPCGLSSQAIQALSFFLLNFLSESSYAFSLYSKGLPTTNNKVTALCLSAYDDDGSIPQPTSFREAEILGLRRMQDGNYIDALLTFQKALKLPGSKLDVIRTPNVSGPSPVGGAKGGTEAREVRTLDEFELQAAYYNMACAHAKLGRVEEAVEDLRIAHQNGFDNISTLTSDPDLRSLQGTPDFEELMDEINPRRNKGLFGLF